MYYASDNRKDGSAKVSDSVTAIRTIRNEPLEAPIGNSKGLQQALQIAKRVSDSNATVLLLGESGVGKEILARSIHAWGGRASHPFIAVNCAALSESLLQSELFGHEKGAFTGAYQQKKGVFEIANRGTVFLDEITDMRLDLQGGLLRVLQDREFVRVGGTTLITTDVRVIAATNQNLQIAVQDGLFRKDLFFRVNVVSIQIPPLRDRKEDIPDLARHFLKLCCRQHRRTDMTLAKETLRLMDSYDWPGNVRELRNVIERAVVLSTQEALYPEDLMISLSRPVSVMDSGPCLMDLPFHESVDAYKRTLLQYSIAKSGGSKNGAATRLKLQPTYLSRLCKRYGVSVSERTETQKAGGETGS